MFSPVKSTAPIVIDRGDVYLDAYGIRYDRNFMLVDEHGVFCSQRRLPQMALIQCSILVEAGLLEIRIPDYSSLRYESFLLPLEGGQGPSVTVSVHEDKNILAMDQDVHDRALNQALSDFLGHHVRVVRIDPKDERRSKTGHRLAFHDAWPLNVASLESLAVLNGWLHDEEGLPPVDMRRFRPNLVLSGCDPFEEDSFFSFQTGYAQLQGTTHCYRCPIPDVDPDTGEAGKGVNVVLSRHRHRRFRDEEGKLKNRIYFGRNLVVTKGAYFEVGGALAFIHKDAGITFDPPRSDESAA